jgi:hypothetical protein
MSAAPDHEQPRTRGLARRLRPRRSAPGCRVSCCGFRLRSNVATYIVAALVLGVYFALNSGTIDSVVYDTVIEETGSADT